MVKCEWSWAGIWQGTTVGKSVVKGNAPSTVWGTAIGSVSVTMALLVGVIGLFGV